MAKEIFFSQFELLDLDLQEAAFNICFVLSLGGFLDGFCPDTHIYIYCVCTTMMIFIT